MQMNLKLQAYGDSACLLRGEGADWCGVLEAALTQDPPAGLVESVRGYATLLLFFAGPVDLAGLECWLRQLPTTASALAPQGRLLELPVCYDGPDLEWVAERSGLTVAQVVAAHSKPEYVVRMMGFMPGFPYLDGLDPRLQLERRASPRDYIAPGSVAIGGPHTGIYSVGSPGGWHLLGRTSQPLFQPEHAQGAEPDPLRVFALRPGDCVRFIPTEQ